MNPPSWFGASRSEIRMIEEDEENDEEDEHLKEDEEKDEEDEEKDEDPLPRISQVFHKSR